MPRKTAPLELAGGKGKRQRVWEAIRRLATANPAAPFTECDIWNATEHVERDVDIAVVRDYRRALQAGGVLSVAAKPMLHTPGRYLLARDCGMDAPRLRKDGTPVVQGLAQEQMWRTLRMLAGDTNARELAAHASTREVAVAESAAKDYIQKLHVAGYLLRTREGKGFGNGGLQARYRLKPARNTGPRPPMVCRTKVIWDPNENKIAWQPPVSEEDAIYGK